jgi:hypothetical protein
LIADQRGGFQSFPQVEWVHRAAGAKALFGCLGNISDPKGTRVSVFQRFAAASAAAAALAAGVTLATPGVAQAAEYNGACGTGYGAIDHLDVSGGTVWLTYSGATGKNCVVTVRNNPGAKKHMDAKISLAGDPWKSDPGNFKEYAGPVYVSARDRCIDWGGEIEDSTAYRYHVHCS